MNSPVRCFGFLSILDKLSEIAINEKPVADQQRREKLKKEIERCEKEVNSSKDVSRSNSRESRRPLSANYRKNLVETEGTVGQPLGALNEQKYVPSHLSTPEKQSTDFPGPEKPVRRDAQKASNISVSCSSVSTPSLHRLHSKASASSSSDSIANKQPPKVQNADSRSNSGDLLEKHSDHFTSNQQPFTPRTLKSDAKSYLSQYRYYMPAKRKMRDILKQQVEAETQTDISREEELLYLGFIQEITDEILKLGLFSNRLDIFGFICLNPCSVEHFVFFRALERLFERHIEQNKNHLDETKMRHLLEILKADLGCSKDDKSVGEPTTFGLQQDEPVEHLQHPCDAQRQSKPATKSESVSEALGLIANEQAQPKSSACSNKFQKVEGKAEFARDLSKPGSTGSDPSAFMVTAETSDTSCLLPPTLSSTTCESYFETSESLREVDDLQESFAESFHLSTDSAQE
ncbi:hypothetical protein lerEdw1_015395 [Lerista edwardsae]|nr:hypothetical protein lerEdw1_015395 [Lerista edwardsae]